MISFSIISSEVAMRYSPSSWKIDFELLRATLTLIRVLQITGYKFLLY